MTQTKNLTVRGIKLQTRTPRRYVVVAVRSQSYVVGERTYEPFAEVVKRTDNYSTALREVRTRRAWESFIGHVIIDTSTGEEV